MKIERCPFCTYGFHYTKELFEYDSLEVNCVRCKIYIITEEAIKQVAETPLNEIQKANASGYIYENQNILINLNKLEEICNIKTPTVNEKANKLLKFISTNFPSPGQKFNYDKIGYKIHIGFGLPLTWSKDIHEYNFIIRDYCVDELHVLDTNGSECWIVHAVGYI